MGVSAMVCYEGPIPSNTLQEDQRTRCHTVTSPKVRAGDGATSSFAPVLAADGLWTSPKNFGIVSMRTRLRPHSNSMSPGLDVIRIDIRFINLPAESSDCAEKQGSTKVVRVLPQSFRGTPVRKKSALSMDPPHILLDALHDSISSGTFIDTKFYAFSRREGSGRVSSPRALYCNGRILDAVPYFSSCA